MRDLAKPRHGGGEGAGGAKLRRPGGGDEQMEDMEISTLMGISGLIIGLLFGALTHRTNFCTMGSIADVISFGDYKRARAWLLAIAVAIIGAQGMHELEMIDLEQSIYLGSTLNWFGSILGGVVFGFGMVIASGCPGRNLARTGGGDLKALVVLIFIGLFGYMALRGLTAPTRAYIMDATSIDLAASEIESQQLGSILSGLIGLSERAARLGSAAVIAIGLVIFCFANREFRGSTMNIVAGVGAGLLITAGWWATGVLGADDFDPAPLVSLTFIAPTGNGLQYMMTFTGATITFGVATVGGAVLGAFLSAILAGRFHLATFYDKGDTLRHMAGGAMMGTGGVLALGCTIGQGMTGVSTLGLGSIIALAAIVVGGIMGVKYMERLIGL